MRFVDTHQTVLIVDDEPDLREAMAFDFTRRGYRVVCAENGRLAFECAQKDPVDVVITDVRMPGGDGLELLTRLKEKDHCRPTVIVITGFADITAESAFARGADEILSKPFDRKLLHDAVKRSTLDPSIKWTESQEGLNDASRPNHSVVCRLERSYHTLSEAFTEGGLLPGRGGFFIHADSRAGAEGGLVEFDLTFTHDPKIPRLKGKGLVRWARSRGRDPSDPPEGFGVEILKLEEPGRTEWLKLIEEKKPVAYIPS